LNPDPPNVRAWTRQSNFLMKSVRQRPSGHIALAEPDDIGIEMTIGTVKFFNTSKGFGFISPEGGGKDVFVHATAVEQAGLRTLQEGQKVSFDVVPDARGAKAANLKAV
jgi:CspA family cold shock protein